MPSCSLSVVERQPNRHKDSRMRLLFSCRDPQDKIGYNKERRNKIRQDKTKQNKTKQNKTKQNKTNQGKTRVIKEAVVDYHA